MKFKFVEGKDSTPIYLRSYLGDELVIGRREAPNRYICEFAGGMEYAVFEDEIQPLPSNIKWL